MQLTRRRKSSVPCGLKSKRKNKTVQRLSGLILGGKFNVLHRILLFILFPFLCKDGKNPRGHRCSTAHMEIRGLEAFLSFSRIGSSGLVEGIFIRRAILRPSLVLYCCFKTEPSCIALADLC